MSLKPAYCKQKAAAKLRGIPWEFCFATWEKFWIESGKLDVRGRGKGKYVMARHGDTGPYSPGNVKAIPHEENSREARDNGPHERPERR